MPVVEGYEFVAYGAGEAIVGTLSTLIASGYRGLSSIVIVIVIVVEVVESSGGGSGKNICGGCGGCAHGIATGFSSALIRLGCKVCWDFTNQSNWCKIFTLFSTQSL